ncbi:hypothetical protein [Terriglobus roseus]|uniref:Uncharacterized protein n=1 Tax=Terriglobus roseus TaxID=392734 RepID=A0A1H4RWD5_9BACT|nr:hypothetical protein [Terriglobus roseus]SEC36235.1 hypothetical protein SAMN05443244_3274 [Terriglobus roseus]
MSQGPFTISFQIHHVQRDLHFLSEALDRKPVFCFTAGQAVGSTVRKTSVWHAQLFGGQTAHDFEQALAALLQYVEAHRSILADFADVDAHMEILLSFKVTPSIDLAHSVQLHPFVLYQLASHQIGLKIQTIAQDL